MTRVSITRRQKPLLTVALLLCAFGCANEVNIGDSLGSPALNTVDTPQYGAEVQAGTVMLLESSDRNIVGLAADESYLYVAERLPESSNKVLKRCNKYNCSATLLRIAESVNSEGGLRRVGAHLVWLGNGVPEYCTLPHCRTTKRTQGIFLDTVSYSSVVFDGARVFWWVDADRSLYECAFPDCNNAPRAILNQTYVTSLGQAGGFIYVLDGGNPSKLIRVDVDHPGASEEVNLNMIPQYAQGAPPSLGYPFFPPNVVTLVVDANYVYLVFDVQPESGEAYEEPAKRRLSLARFRGDSPLGSFEWLLRSDSVTGSASNVAVVDGDVFFIDEAHHLTSCIAEQCDKTMRMLGGAAATDAAWHPMFAVDKRFVYWVSELCLDDLSCSRQQLKRSPRALR